MTGFVRGRVERHAAHGAAVLQRIEVGLEFLAAVLEAGERRGLALRASAVPRARRCDSICISVAVDSAAAA